MSARVLYIIGNGFDLHHELATDFSDFKSFVAGRRPDLKTRVEKYLCALSGNWANLEEALAYFDVDQLMDDASNFLVPYGANEWSDAYHHSYQYEINEVVRAVSSQLKDEFATWVQQIPVSPTATSKRLKIRPNACFLNFNYTETVEELYSVSRSQILHIHGSVEDGEEEIVLGHGWETSARPNFTEWGNPEDIDTRVMEGYELIERYFEDTFKPTKEILKRNQKFFADLTDVSDIYVWGLSLSEVDLPYLAEVASVTNPVNPTWHVSHRTPSSIEGKSAAMSSIGVHESRVRHHRLVEYAC